MAFPMTAGCCKKHKIPTDCSTAQSSSPQVPPIPIAALDHDNDPYLFIEEIIDFNLGDIVHDPNMELSSLFARKNFLDLNHGDWIRLQPVLRLVTVILSSHRAHRFFNIIFFGAVAPKKAGEETTTLSNPVRGPLSTTQEDLVRFVLNVMAKDVTFSFATNFDNPMTFMNLQVRAKFPGGYGARMVFPDKLYEFYQAAQNTWTVGAERPITKILTMKRIFRLAADMCHEIAHAAWMYRTTEREPHFTQICGSSSELGIAFEIVLFGGIHEDIKGPKSKPLQIIRLGDGTVEAVHVRSVDVYRPWPVWQSVRMYQDDSPDLMSVRSEHINYLDIVVRVPLRAVAAFFTKAHWSVPIDDTNLATVLEMKPGKVDITSVVEAMSLPGKIRAVQSIAGLPLYHKGMFSLREVDIQQLAIHYARQSVGPSKAQEWLDTVQSRSAKHEAKKPVLSIDDNRGALVARAETPEARKRRGHKAIRKIRALREHGKAVGQTVSLLEYLLVSGGPAGRLGMLLQKTLKVPIRVSRTILFSESVPYSSGRIGNTCWGPMNEGEAQGGEVPVNPTIRV